MGYQDALEWIMSYWEPTRSKSEERSLRPLKVPRMRALLAQLDSPQLSFPSILVAGTKGKGSTAALIAEGLRAAGFRVGRYTQPHLIDWRERSWVDGSLIEADEVAELAERIRPAVESLHNGIMDLGRLTTYEVGTALTLSYFAQKQVDIAVLEIGIGGRLDALNAVDPILSVVTSISLDHTDVLGNTLEEIAAEKAGILRPGGIAVSSPQRPEAMGVLRQVALEKGTRLYEVGRDWRWAEGRDPGTIRVNGPFGVLEDLKVKLLGNHQRDNATVATAVLQLLAERGFPVDEDAIRVGLAEVIWPGRVQRLREEPTVVADCAHNGDSVRRLMETIRGGFRYERLILVFGASADKDVAGMAAVLGPAASVVVATSSGHRRAAQLDGLAGELARYTDVEIEADVATAFQRALVLASPQDLVLVTGSVFLAGKAIELLGT